MSNPHPLGRLVRHDPRSLRFPVGVLPRTARASVQWTRRAPIVDQGTLGSCVGQTMAGLLGTDAAGYTGQTSVTVGTTDPYGIIPAGVYQVDVALGELVYQLCTRLDEFPGQYEPTDTGSSGLAGAQTLKALGFVDVYRHAFALDAVASALQAGPVAVGTVWLDSMFDPRSDGLLTVNRRSSAAGGHEYLIVGYDAATDVYRIANSWGVGWGVGGYATIRGADLGWLLSQQGDVIAPTLVTPTPEPEPAQPDSADDALADVLGPLVPAAQAWLAAYSRSA